METNRIRNESNVIHVTVPSSVANNFDKMAHVTKSVLAKLGCEGCHSGKQIIFHEEDNYFVDESLNIRPIENIKAIGQ